MTQQEAIDRAIRNAGGQSALGRAIGTSQQSVWKMLNKAGRASAEFVLSIEAATGISRHDLRPDLYPRELSGDLAPVSSPAVSTPAGTAPATSSPASLSPRGDEAGGGRGTSLQRGAPIA